MIGVGEILIWSFFLVSVFLVMFLGILLHEGTHYAVARIWTSKHRISSTGGRLPIPDRIEFENPFEIPNYGVRAAGIAPIIWAPMFLIQLAGHWGRPTFESALITSFFLSAAVISPHDILAFLKPKEWKNMTANDGEFGFLLVFLVLINIRSAPWNSS